MVVSECMVESVEYRLMLKGVDDDADDDDFIDLSIVPFRSPCREPTSPRLGAEFSDCEPALEQWRLAASDLRSAERLCRRHSSRNPGQTRRAALCIFNHFLTS